MPRRPRLDPREYVRKHYCVGPTWPEYEEQRKALWFAEDVRERLSREAVELAREDIAAGRVDPRDREEAIRSHLYVIERVEVVLAAMRFSRFPPRDDDD